MKLGLIVLPKSVTASRIVDNYVNPLELYGKLTEEDVASLMKIDKDFRFMIPMVELPDGSYEFRDGFMTEFPFRADEAKLGTKAVAA